MEDSPGGIIPKIPPLCKRGAREDLSRMGGIIPSYHSREYAGLFLLWRSAPITAVMGENLRPKKILNFDD